MAVTTLQVTQTGSAVSVAATGTYARWVIFQDNAGHSARAFPEQQVITVLPDAMGTEEGFI